MRQTHGTAQADAEIIDNAIRNTCRDIINLLWKRTTAITKLTKQTSKMKDGVFLDRT